jgi:molecular chaperone DnaJ
MTQADYYQLLGITPTATLEQIKAAYRRQALRHHPDKNPGSEEAAERFKRCNEAHAVLSDPGRRAEYDARRSQKGVQEIARDIIGDFLGRKRVRKRDGGDLRFDLRITLREAAEGARKQIRFPAAEVCEVCGGGGAAAGGTVRCQACGGRGDTRDEGFLSLPRPCPRCGGQGVTITKVCAECGGIGSVERQRRYSVKLPSGVRDGDVKILDGEGEKGSGGGRPGDLHVVVLVEPHPLLKQEGNNLTLDLPVRYVTAVLGGIVDVPTLTGQVRMKVPEGTQSGRVFRLKGKGLPSPGGGHGDQLVRVVVETPVSLGDAARRSLLAFDEACAPETHPLKVEVEEQLRGLQAGEKGDDARNTRAAGGSKP